ncbi:MAG: hypothetical protein IPH50_04305 [Rhodanobacteraceae bacterium]|nr:hypothetical protein [Rhodanobacteraceae bacterium]
MRNIFGTLMCGLMLIVGDVLVSNAVASVPSPAAVSSFQPNIGQLDARVAFWAERDGIALFVTRDGELVHRFAGSDGRDWVMVERLHDAQSMHPVAVGEDVTRITRIDTDGTRSATTTRRINIGEPWPGIRAELWLSDDQFEKRFELAAGANAKAIRMTLDGVDHMSIADDGQLLLATGLGDVLMSAPIAWQNIDGRRVDVPVAYALADSKTYGFKLGDHDANYPLTIDPIIRSTFAGSNSSDGLAFMSINTDSVYVAGGSYSNNFPGMTGGFQPTIIYDSTSPKPNFLVARFSLDLTTLHQATFYGKFGPVPDSGGISAGLELKGLHATDSGVYIAGTAPGKGDHVRTTPGAFQPVANGGAQQGNNIPTDGFIARLSPDLTQLQAGTYFGTDDYDSVWSMTVGSDAVFVAGQARSAVLPGIANGANPVKLSAGFNAYVAKISLDLTTAISATWISGGASTMTPYALTLGTDGSVYVGGSGRGTLVDTTGAYQPTGSTQFSEEAFVTHLSADLGTHLRSTFLGGNTANDRIDYLKFGEGNLYASGTTSAFNFPVPANAAVPVRTAGSSFVFALSADLTTRVGGTYWGGTSETAAAPTFLGRLATHDGTIYLAGNTRANSLPGTLGGAQPDNTGTRICGYVAAFNPTLTTIKQATYIACGEPDRDVYVNDLAFANNALYLTGTTNRATLPGSATGAQPMNAGSGNDDGFIMIATGDLAGPRPNADLAVEKTGSLERVANHYVRYWVSVTNNGPDAAVDALIQDTLPPEIGAANWICTAFNGAVCPNASGSGSIAETVTLPNGGRLEYELCALAINAASDILNVAAASVASHTLAPVSGNNSDDAALFDPRLFADGFESVVLPPFCPSM